VYCITLLTFFVLIVKTPRNHVKFTLQFTLNIFLYNIFKVCLLFFY